MDTHMVRVLFRPYPGHTIFAHNANVLLGVVENVKTGTNPYSWPYPTYEAGSDDN